jgi:copper chaperone CopZ
MITLRVEDLTCEYCGIGIGHAVHEADGLARCEVDVRSKTVRIDSGLPAEAFLVALRHAGYRALRPERGRRTALRG